ncbi:MAG: MerR family transcriptional regulator [Oscillospiraceae bacterium]|nr:MerR family transcriptional regulator [Oscillospiraceae bacterium]
MDYTITELAQLAGVSARTLRYYDQIGLLRPVARTGGSYRLYGPAEVDRLQQILFYKARGLELDTIARLLDDPDFDGLAAMQEHLTALQQRQERLAGLIRTVQDTIHAMKGEREMSDAEKFLAFKQGLVTANEAEYGAEARQNYGDAAVDAANARLLGMSREQYEAFQALGEEILARLEAAVTAGLDPAEEEGQTVAALHRRWLGFTWDRYTPAAHRGLVQMYRMDERFTAYYDRRTAGCTEFLCRAVEHWVK